MTQGEIDKQTLRIYRDGNMWCATFGDFINSQESPAGFGVTIIEAITSLLRSTGDVTPGGEAFRLGSEMFAFRKEFIL